MRKEALAAALAIAALSLSGCTGGATGPADTEQSTNSASKAYEGTPAATDSALVSEQKKQLAAISMNIWLNVEGAHSLDGFSEPYSLITDWTSGGDSDSSLDWTIELTVSDDVEDLGDDPEGQLHMIASEMMTVVNSTASHVEEITATTEDGEYSATVRD